MNHRLFLHYARLRLKERMEYRGAFLIGMAVQALGYAGSYLVIWLMLQRFETIGGWNWPEIALLYSLNLFTYGLGAAFSYTPMVELEKLVQKGTLDPVLIRPRDPYFTLTAQMFNVGYLSHILLSGGILIWAVGKADIAWSFATGGFLVLSIIGGMLIQMGALTFVGAWTITQVRSDVLFRLYYSVNGFQNYPLSIFHGAIQIMLSTIVPLAFVNFYPAMILLGKDGGVMPNAIGWLTPLVGPVVFLLAYRVWMRAIDRYQGAGG